MKKGRRSLKSIFRAELIVQQQRDEGSGLFVSDRFFQPAEKQQAHRVRWILINLMLLGMLVTGLIRLTVTGFGVPVANWFYAAVGGMCLAGAAISRSEWCGKHRMALTAVGLLGYLGLLFFLQDDFLNGAMQLVNRGIRQLNEVYTGSLEPLFNARGMEQVQTFLLCITPLLVTWIAYAVLHSSSMILTNLLVIPAVAVLLLLDAVGDTAGKFLLLFGFILAIALSRTKKQRRMWGGDNEKLHHENRLRFESIRMKSGLIVFAMCAILAVPGFLLVRPFLAVTLEPARQLSTEVQTDVLNRVMKLLPDLTAGQWNLNVQTVSGGVQDGSLGNEAGYLLEGVEDLRLVLTQKPEDALFLKGYVGAKYENGSWEPAPAYRFDGAAMNWHTQGSPRLFVQNLSFLRTAYVLNQLDSEDDNIRVALGHIGNVDPIQIRVERINGNPGYTYVPYGVYLNDYYEIDGGDGAVTGQQDQEDRYFYFDREDMERILTTWNGIPDTANVLDRVEESYRAYCRSSYTEIPEGMESLQEEVDRVREENRWRPEEDLDEITRWIRLYLAENYSYATQGVNVPEGEDALRYFLFNSGKGNSVHFASAAVVLYRMFGVPARYVVGYEVPAVIFTVQTGGIYTATAQGDNAQAWAEVYVAGQGWSPRDMTPGIIGTLEEVGPGGIRVEMPEEDGEEKTDETGDPEGTDDVPEMTGDDIPVEQQTEETGASLSLEDMILILGLVAGGGLVLALICLGYGKICRDLGFRGLRKRTDLQRLLGVFRAVFRRTVRLKLPKGIDSQSEVFRSFLEEELKNRGFVADSNTTAAVEKMYGCVYGGKPVEDGDIQTMRRILLGLYGRKRQK